MKTTALVFSLTAAVASGAFAQAPADPPEKSAVAANDRAYEAAFDKADVKALTAFFSDDAEYTADDGRTFSGSAAIEAAIRAGLLANRGAKLAIAMDSVKVLAPGVVLEKGTTTVTARDGSTSGALYSAIHVKNEGKWKINQLIETPLPTVSARDHLIELEWLVGEWEDADKTNDTNVRSQFTWARGGNFLTRNVTVKRSGNLELEGWQIIGWDPIAEHIRSWTFDSEGGFSEGTWTREGQRWLLRETGVSSDGNRTSADNTFTRLSPDRFTWESNNRTLDGDPQPNIARIEINRVKGN